MLLAVWKKESVLRQPFEPVNDEPVLPKEDRERLAPELVEIRVEVAVGVVDRALRGLDEAVERAGLRRTSVLALILLAAGCRDFDRYSRIGDDKGLVPADVFARYGSEQARPLPSVARSRPGMPGPTRPASRSRSSRRRIMPGRCPEWRMSRWTWMPTSLP